HHNAALTALGEAIEQYRVVAYELAPDDLEARMMLAGLYVARMELRYYHLPVLQNDGDMATLDQYLAAIGEDMTRVREATDALRMGDEPGDRVRVIEAWSYFVRALE